MAWIKTIPYEQADEPLRRVYDAFRALYPVEYRDAVPALIKPDGTDESISAVQSLIPDAMGHMMAGLAAMMQPHLPLTRRQHEMIAAVVSVENSCFY